MPPSLWQGARQDRKIKSFECQAKDAGLHPGPTVGLLLAVSRECHALPPVGYVLLRPDSQGTWEKKGILSSQVWPRPRGLGEEAQKRPRAPSLWKQTELLSLSVQHQWTCPLRHQVCPTFSTSSPPKVYQGLFQRPHSPRDPLLFKAF